MKKINFFRRVMPILALLFVGLGSLWAETATSTSMTAKTSYQDLENGKLIEYKMSAANNYSAPLRVYANNTFTIHAKTGVEKITKIEITANTDNNGYTTNTRSATWSASGTGTCSVSTSASSNVVTATVTGTATTVTCKPSSQVRWDKVIVTYVTSGGSVEQYSYTLTTVGSGTTTFKDASNNVIAPSQKVDKGTKLTPTFAPADGYEFTSWEYYTSVGAWSEVSGTEFTISKDVQFRVTYTATRQTPTLSFAEETYYATKGQSFTAPTVTTDPAGLDVTYSSSNTNVATVNEETGAVSLVAAGTTKITASFAGNETYKEASASYDLVVAGAKYAVTIQTPENGALTIKDGETTINSGDEVEEGKTLTVIPAPASGYRFKNWGYKDGDANWVGNMTSTFTHVMPSAPCQFKATFEAIPTYTVAWYVNGTKVKSETVYEGTSVTAPAVEDINDKVFRGWSEAASVNSETGDMVTPIATAMKSVTYYAVFADQDGEGSSAVDVEPANVIAYWESQSITKDTYIPATYGTGSLTSSITLSTASGYAYNGTAAANTQIILSGLDMSAYAGKDISLNFVSRASGAKNITVSTSIDGVNYTVLTSTANLTGTAIQYTISDIPSTATNIKLVYNGTSGSFFFGSAQIKTESETNYEFEKLTATNTSEWSGADWEGYYVIANGSNALSAGPIGEKSFVTITPENNVVTISDHNAIFHVTYDEERGYAVQGLGYGYYLGYASNSVSGGSNATYMSSIGYNSMNYTNGSSNYHLQYNSSKFGFYAATSNFVAPTFYKILASPATYSNYTTIVGSVSLPVSITSVGYATFAPAYDVLVPGDVEVYYASNVTNEDIEFTQLDENAKVRAGEGLLLKADAGNYTFTVDNSNTAVSLGENKLIGVLVATPAANLPANSYILAKAGDEAVFCPITGGTLAAGKAYLVRPAQGGAPLRISFVTNEGQTATSLENIDQTTVQKFFENGQIYILKAGHVYNVSGQIVR